MTGYLPENLKEARAINCIIPTLLQCMQFPAILEHRLMSVSGNSLTLIIFAILAVTGNPRDASFSRPVKKRDCRTPHVRPPDILKVGMRPLAADHERLSAESPK